MVEAACMVVLGVGFSGVDYGLDFVVFVPGAVAVRPPLGTKTESLKVESARLNGGIHQPRGCRTTRQSSWVDRAGAHVRRKCRGLVAAGSRDLTEVEGRGMRGAGRNTLLRLP